MSTSITTDEQLAERLQFENCDQFDILVRMHLSFVLDLNAEESGNLTEKCKLRKWVTTSFSSKKTKYHSGVDGVPLTQEGIHQAYQLITFLKQEANICVEGIFRRTGSLNRQQELKNLLIEGSPLNLESGIYSVHDCASILKVFLAELPEPLLTEAHYPVYCQIAELYGSNGRFRHESRLLESLQLLLLLLPKENRAFLKDVLNLLHLTASYESQNKMSADSLATLYTPHLFCPRKLSPEILHANSQMLSRILSYMINKSPEIFLIPRKLAVDIKAYYAGRERRIHSPQKYFDESVSDNLAAHTVYSFVDHERTTKENEANPTETAVAQLYAYIQSLPESSKKQKLVKQFNKQNGHGIPLQSIKSNGKNKNLADSVKKHIFQKGLLRCVKKTGLLNRRSSSEELLNTPQQSMGRKKILFCTSCSGNISDNGMEHTRVDSPIISDRNPYLTSTPACISLHVLPNNIFSPYGQERKSVSPITKSTQNMCLAMQETMMTPRSRKPVLVLSGTNINNLPKLSNQTLLMESLIEEKSVAVETVEISESQSRSHLKKSKSESSLLSYEAFNHDDADAAAHDVFSIPFREYILSRSIFTPSPVDLSFSSRTDDYSSNDFKELNCSKMSSSLLHYLNGSQSDFSKQWDAQSFNEERKLVLKPKQFDEKGHPTVFETSF